MAAAISALIKAANGLFHLTALEAVSSPGTSSHPMKLRMLHAWSRTEHNPGNWLRLCKIGPFCRASAVGCWESAVFCKLCLFSQGMKLFGFISKRSLKCRHPSPVQGAIPPQKFQAQQDAHWMERLWHPFYTVATSSSWFPKQRRCYKSQKCYVKLQSLFCLYTRSFLAALRSSSACQFLISLYNPEQ